MLNACGRLMIDRHRNAVEGGCERNKFVLNRYVHEKQSPISADWTIDRSQL
jgi:hypothetical protein